MNEKTALTTEEKKAIKTKKWLDRLAGLAETEKDIEAKQMSAPYISTQGGVFTYQKAELENPLHVVIVDQIFDNAYYKYPFRPNVFQAPVCYALNHDSERMAPHELAPEPHDETCEECEFNVFGSSDTGGKLCKNQRRLMVLAANDLEDIGGGVDNLALLRISPTSIAAYSKYAYNLSMGYHRPVCSVVTAIELVKVAGRTYHTFKFSVHTKINDEEQLDRILKLQEVGQGLMFAPYPAQRDQGEKKESAGGASY